MIEIILFIITAIFVIGVTIVEARHDWWVMKYQNYRHDKWKFWGNFYELAWIVFVSGLVAYLLGKWSPVLWILILWMIRWIVHDCFIGKFLTNDWFHLGSTGFDGAMKRIFQHGFIYLIWKVVILIMATGSYFAIK